MVAGSVKSTAGGLVAFAPILLRFGADGKILLAGGFYLDVMPRHYDAILTRFNADGSLDAGFGTGGVVSWLGGADARENQYLHDMLLEPDGTVLLTGSIGFGMNVTDLFLMKFK